MTFQPFEPSYSNHIGMCFHPVNFTAYMLVTWRLAGQGPFSLQIWEHAPPYTAQPILKRSWKQGVEVPGPFGYGTLMCMPDGGLYIAVPGGVDAVNQIKPSTMLVPGMCAPFAAEGITFFHAPLTTPAWDNRVLEGGAQIDVPSEFHCAPASSYLLRFVVSAAAADVRVRAGTEVAPSILTVNTQVPDVQIHTQGWVPGPLLYVSTVNGPAHVWLQIVGYTN